LPIPLHSFIPPKMCHSPSLEINTLPDFQPKGTFKAVLGQKTRFLVGYWDSFPSWRIIPGLVSVVNNHGDRCCPRRIRLWDPGPIHGHSWLINGGYQALPHWDDPPSKSIGTIGMVYLTYMKGCFFMVNVGIKYTN